MTKTKAKGYRTERKIRKMFEKSGWLVFRAGASLGEADLVCMKEKKCIFLQIKSTVKDTLYYYGSQKNRLEGFPFYLVVDFGYGKIRILPPKHKISSSSGKAIEDFLRRN